jgi:indole-3-glycerol phosphate synthase
MVASTFVTRSSSRIAPESRIRAPMGFLTDITSRIRRGLEDRPLDEGLLMTRALLMPPAHDFTAAIRSGSPAVIAEMKRSSPSVGAIAEDADPVLRARAYAAGGAAAISILTEPSHFHGSLLDLQAARSAVDLPLLRKDFLVHPGQVIEARANGADAVLLITACLSDSELVSMLAAASDMGLGVLLETHSDADQERALGTDARVIGVNARDLETLDVDIEAALERLRRIPPDRVSVLESGISSRSQAEDAMRAGASAILVGEALMRAGDPAAMLRELRGEEPDV